MGDLRSAAAPRGSAFALVAAICVTLFSIGGLVVERLARAAPLVAFGERIDPDALVGSANLAWITAAILVTGISVGSTLEMRARPWRYARRQQTPKACLVAEWVGRTA